jgi:hypothetical protein
MLGCRLKEILTLRKRVDNALDDGGYSSPLLHNGTWLLRHGAGFDGLVMRKQSILQTHEKRNEHTHNALNVVEISFKGFQGIVMAFLEVVVRPDVVYHGQLSHARLRVLQQRQTGILGFVGGDG